MIVYTTPRNAGPAFLRAGDEVALVTYPDGGVVIFAGTAYVNTYLERVERDGQDKMMGDLAWAPLTQDAAPALDVDGHGETVYEVFLKLPGMTVPSRFLRNASQAHAVRIPAEIDPWDSEPEDEPTPVPQGKAIVNGQPVSGHDFYLMSTGVMAPEDIIIPAQPGDPQRLNLVWCTCTDSPIEGPHIHMASDR